MGFQKSTGGQMTMPTHTNDTYIAFPVVGEVWSWHSIESWEVVYIGSVNDIWGNIGRDYITVLNLHNNQLRTVWLRSFMKRWVKLK